jgi:hypothetical protein
VVVQAKEEYREEYRELTKPQLCKMIVTSDSSLKRIMKDLNMKSCYRHEVPVNKKKTDLIVNKSINKGTKEANFQSVDLYTQTKYLKWQLHQIINYDFMINSDKT